MSLGNPWGLLLLTALAPLVVLYLLRRRLPPHPTTTLFLWRDALDASAAGGKLERLRRELSLLLEVLAVLAGTLALSQVSCGGERRGPPALVLDGSLSMAARLPDGDSVASRVRAAAFELLAGSGPDGLIVIESGPTPRLLSAPGAAPADVRRALEAWLPRGPTHEPQPGLVLAEQLARGGAVFFFTDTLEGVAQLPPGVEVRAFGAPVSNVGLVSARRFDDERGAEIVVGVESFGAAAKVTVRYEAASLTGRAPARGMAELSLPAGVAIPWRLRLPAVGPVQVSLPADPLLEDNLVSLAPAPLLPVPVSLAPGLSEEEARALLQGLAVVPGVVGADSAAHLSFGPRGGAARVSLGAGEPVRLFVGPFARSTAHPLLDDVRLDGVVWAAGPGAPGEPLVWAGETPLLSEDVDGSVHLNLDVARSNLQRTAAWPVLLSNLVRRARRELPGFSAQNAVLGATVEATGRHGDVLRSPDGVESRLSFTGPFSLGPLALPGRHELLRDGAVAGALEVLPIAPAESDLSTRAAGVAPRTAATAARREPPGRPSWLLVVMLLLLLADFWVTGRGVAAPSALRAERGSGR